MGLHDVSAFLAVLTRQVALTAFEAIKVNGLGNRFDVLLALITVFVLWTYLSRMYIEYVRYADRASPGWVELQTQFTNLGVYLLGFLSAAYLGDIADGALPGLGLGVVELVLFIFIGLALVFGTSVYVERYAPASFHDLNHRSHHTHM